MFADVEQKDGSYKLMDIPEPEGCFYCDTCGDCLHCEDHDSEPWCPTGGRWVVYLGDERHPASEKNKP